MWDSYKIDGEHLASEYFSDIDFLEDLKDITDKTEKEEIFVEVIGELYYEEWTDYFGEFDSNTWIEKFEYREIESELFLKYIGKIKN